MPTTFENFVDQMINLPDAAGVWQCTAEFGRTLGFESCSLTLAERVDSKLISAYLITDLGNEFSEAYVNGGLVEIDPFLLFNCDKPCARKVVTGNLSSFPRSSSRHQAFMDHITENGTTGGVGIPVRTTDNRVFGGWVFSSRESKPAFDRLVVGHGHKVQLAGLLAHERMIALGLGNRTHQQQLSGREREVLLWLSGGYRVSMIADKLGVSESAVSLYLKNARLKLGAKTREQAIARAISTGQIEL